MFNIGGIPLEATANSFDSIVRGMVTGPQKLTDHNFDVEVKNFLFRGNKEFGSDLLSLDIQRARDHGIPSYNDFREFCKLGRAQSWDDYTDLIAAEHVDKLKQIYSSFDDLELVVGGQLETIIPDTFTGPTYQCIIGIQFRRLRSGDLFFFENGEGGVFTNGTLLYLHDRKNYGKLIKYFCVSDQLNEIRKASLAKLLCFNSNIQQIQPHPLLRISESNPLVPCSDLPSINMDLWKNKP